MKGEIMEFIKNNTEAIKQIQNILDWTKTHDYVEIDACHEEALQMAMAALERVEALDTIRAIVSDWKDDTWTDNASYECMVKIAEIVEGGSEEE